MKRHIATVLSFFLFVSLVMPTATAKVSTNKLEGTSSYKVDLERNPYSIGKISSMLITSRDSQSTKQEIANQILSWPIFGFNLKKDITRVTDEIFQVDFTEEISQQSFFELRNQLLRRNLVKAVEVNTKLSTGEQDLNENVSANATQEGATWGLDRVDQRLLPLNGSYNYEQTGANIYAYVVDSGLRTTHIDFAGRVESGFHNVNDGLGVGDCEGHGTHVAGTIGGSKWGIAKNVRIVPVRVLDCQGETTAGQLLQAISWIENDVISKGRKAVVNMSLGGSYNAMINNAVEGLISKGIVVVVASGNEAANACLSSPASALNAITVNASTPSDFDASFSNFGPCTDIYAPGEAIASSYIYSDSSAATLSGTSMASPHVAGVVALLLQKFPTYTPAQVWSYFQSMATKADFLPNVPNDAKYLLYSGTAPQNTDPIGPDTNADLYLLGASISYEESQLYEPTGCSVFYFSYANRTSVDLLTLGILIRSRWNDLLEWDTEIGIDDGVSGTWDLQICSSDLTDGLGPYFITLTISDYVGTALTTTREMEFVPRPNSTRSIVSLVPIPEDQQTISVFGTSLSWDNSKHYFPLGCSMFDIEYSNNSGGRLLSLQADLLSQYGDRINFDSVIGIEDEIYGVFHFFVCKSQLQQGNGPYTLRLSAQRYSSDGGGTFTTQAQINFKSRPQYLQNTPTPSMTGEFRVGKQLTVQTGTWDAGVTFQYQWRRDGNAIESAVNPTYTLSSEDYGKKLSVSVTGSKPGFVTESETSADSVVVGLGQFNSITAPVIQGETRVGNSVTVKALDWDLGVNYSYQWKIDGNIAQQGSSNTFVIPVEAWQKSLSVEVTGTKSFYESASRTSASSVVLGKIFSTIGMPAIQGVAKVGKTLRVQTSGWISQAETISGLTISFQWYRSGNPLQGKNASSLKLTKAFANKKVSVVLTASASGYQPTQVTISSKKIKK